MSLRPPYPLDKMPKLVLDIIVENTEADDRMILRKSCKTFRELADKKYHYIKTMAFSKSPDRVDLRITTGDNSELEISYTKDSSDCKVEFMKRDRMGFTITPKRTKIITGTGYLTTALSDFATFINNPKCFVGHLTLSNWQEETCIVPLMRTLTSMKTTLSVQKLLLSSKVSENFVLEMLPFFKPGTLKEVVLDVGNHEYGEILMELDQWKLAKEASVYGHVPISQFLHFNQFSTRVKNLSLEDVKLMTETAIQRVEEFEGFTVNSNEFADISLYLKTMFPIATNKDTSRYRRIGESNLYLKMFHNQWCISIEKKVVVK